MSKVTLDEVRQLAILSKLALEESEMQGLQGDLSVILDHMERLSEVDTEGVLPMTHVQQASAAQDLRPDVAKASLAVEEVLSASANTQDGCFSVPAVLPPSGGAS